jgi:hypothetical protein
VDEPCQPAFVKSEALTLISFGLTNEASKINRQHAVAVLKENLEIRSRLASFGVTRDELLAVVAAAVGARRSASALAPASAGGLMAWIRGTEELRAVFLPKDGWEMTRTDNIEAVYHAGTGIKIIYQSADRAGDPIADPVAVSKKGLGSARAVENGQGDLFPEYAAEALRELNAASWYLFVHADGDDVRAELSFPMAIEDDQFHGFNERILLIQKGEWDIMDLAPDESPAPELEILVRRKK